MKKTDRRTFVVDAAKAGSAVAGLSLFPQLLSAQALEKTPPPAETVVAAPPDISVVTGKDYFQATVQAVEKLGGIGRFVTKGDTVGLMSNTWAKKPGTYTQPAVTLAVAHLCYEAGAKQVYMVKNEDEDYWNRSRVSQQHAKLIARLKPDDSDHKKIKIKGAKTLKEANILTGPMGYDRLINIPLIKNHSGVHMTCTLKNMMGLTSFTTNVGFHMGPSPLSTLIKDIGNFFSDLEHFSQCVADLNLVRKVDLCVVDATEFITTNGPSGPGVMSRPLQVVAGTDRVAIDSLCCGFLKINPAEIGMITRAAAHGLGTMDMSKLSISRTAL